MNSHIEIYKYYQTLPEINKLVFIDTLESLVLGIKTIDKIKENYTNNEYKKYYSYFVDFFHELGMINISGFMVYKKVDYTANKKIAELIDISSNQTISNFAMVRRIAIMKLIEQNIIQDLNISIDSICSEEIMIEEGLIEIKQNQKQFNLDSVLNEKLDPISIIKDGKIDNRLFSIFLCKSILGDLKKYYGEDTLNEDLNKDESYKQIICYKTEKVQLDEILLNIKKDGNKEIIEELEIKQNNIYINGEKFKIKDSIKTSGFIELLSGYLETHDTKRIAFSHLIDFYDENYRGKNKESLILKIGNIKNTFIRTIRKQVGKIYLNNEIIKIKGSDIILM